MKIGLPRRGQHGARAGARARRAGAGVRPRSAERARGAGRDDGGEAAGPTASSPSGADVLVLANKPAAARGGGRGVARNAPRRSPRSSPRRRSSGSRRPIPTARSTLHAERRGRGRARGPLLRARLVAARDRSAAAATSSAAAGAVIAARGAADGAGDRALGLRAGVLRAGRREPHRRRGRATASIRARRGSWSSRRWPAPPRCLDANGLDAVALRSAVTTPGGVTAPGLAAARGVRAARRVRRRGRPGRGGEHAVTPARDHPRRRRRLRRRAVPRLPDPDLRADPAELDPAHPLQPLAELL